jgi:D-alanyl-D-alanine carboxypeptidase (penicillin-binding protein 5/6)
LKFQKKNQTFFELDTWLGKKNKIMATTKEDFYVTVNKKDIRHISVKLEYKGPISAPVKKGSEIANIIISKKEKIIKKLPLYAAEDVNKVNFFKSLLTSLNYLIWGDV